MELKFTAVHLQQVCYRHQNNDIVGITQDLLTVRPIIIVIVIQIYIRTLYQIM